MTDLVTAARQAMGTLEIAEGACAHPGFVKMIKSAISDLQAALEQVELQPIQEPVAWYDKHGMFTHDPFEGVTPLYTEPPKPQWQEIDCPCCGDLARAFPPAPKREWVGLTDEEIAQGNTESWITQHAFESAVWWAEQKLKEKNA